MLQIPAVVLQTQQARKGTPRRGNGINRIKEGSPRDRGSETLGLWLTEKTKPALEPQSLHSPKVDSKIFQVSSSSSSSNISRLKRAASKFGPTCICSLTISQQLGAVLSWPICSSKNKFNEFAFGI